MSVPADVLAQLCALVKAHARPDGRTAVDGLRLSRVSTSEPDDPALTEPLLVVLAQGGKRLFLGDEVHEYHAGECLVVTADLPLTGHFLGATPEVPALGLALALRPPTVAALLPQAPPARGGTPQRALGTGPAGPELLDAALRMLRLLDHPADVPVLAPLVEREIVWRLLTGPHGDRVRRIGLPGGAPTVNRAIQWIRDNHAEPMRIDDLARLAGMSPSAFHRQFRAVTGMSPLQYQKRIRLQEARTLLIARAGDVVRVAHLVGYDSPSQFNREYRRLFGSPPAQDAARLRAGALPSRPV